MALKIDDKHMQLNNQELKELCQLACLAATEAGRMISTFSNQQLQIKRKPTQNTSLGLSGGTSWASQIVTEVDIKSQELIIKQLSPSIKKYHFGLLTEESMDDQSRLEKDYFWCIDPLDGTLPFTEGKDGYSVSIALVSKEGAPIIGVVYDPAKKNLYHAIKGIEVCKNDNELYLKHTSKNFTFITDRSFITHHKFKQIKAGLLKHSQSCGYNTFTHINQGGAAMNALWY
ncbi:3'(2'),5'-bisphosphate nucleotidase CysQ family protein [Saccharicrinis fermentans]|uniref:Inositol-1-monophosphatase n=1 Tax=Saccharicrinis fermentans DSM 9555 = JCM 21142 TaxID=869213 RepID=W7Y4H1_9BACT|nr:inositol monophosphatase family protein [Saccharicrinis fermentans]GAF03002.1 inositol-1-monophosphatase [Saccharicrinis fermentans DSM 9555 = JCM 21142]